MTLDDAIRFQEKWKAKPDTIICKHTQLFDHLTSASGEKTNSVVCLVCVEVSVDPGV